MKSTHGHTADTKSGVDVLLDSEALVVARGEARVLFQQVHAPRRIRRSVERLVPAKEIKSGFGWDPQHLLLRCWI